MIHDTAWFLSLALMAAVVLVFAVVCAGAGTRGSVGQPYRGRGVFLWGLLLAGVLITVSTMLPWPVEAYAERSRNSAAAATVRVVGHQWRWELSATEVPVGKPVDFELTAADVNHGFGIYKSKQRMLAQVQAMPGFTNRLRVTFDEPGEYELLCMEYCGVAHHRMIAVITAR